MSKSILRTLQKIKSTTIPKAPQNAAEITNAFNVEAVREKFGRTIRSDEEKRTEFFKGAVEHDNYSFCVFASEEIIQAIESQIPEQQRKLFTDGTFGVSFKLIAYLFSITELTNIESNRFKLKKTCLILLCSNILYSVLTICSLICFHVSYKNSEGLPEAIQAKFDIPRGHFWSSMYFLDVSHCD